MTNGEDPDDEGGTENQSHLSSVVSCSSSLFKSSHISKLIFKYHYLTVGPRIHPFLLKDEFFYSGPSDSDQMEIIVNQYGYSFQCSITVAQTLSPTIKKSLAQNQHLSCFLIDIDSGESDFQKKDFELLNLLFNGKKVQIRKDNFGFLKKISTVLKISELAHFVTVYEAEFTLIERFIDINSGKAAELLDIENVFSTLSTETFDDCLKTLLESNLILTTDGIDEIVTTAISSTVWNPNTVEILVDLCIELKNNASQNNKLDRLIPQFTNTLLCRFDPNFHFLIYKFYENGFIIDKILRQSLRYFKDVFFYCYFAPEVERIDKDSLLSIIDVAKIPTKSLWLDSFLNELPQLRSNNWELHKTLRKAGYSNNIFWVIIKKDDIEDLQRYISHVNFDYNHELNLSIYDRSFYFLMERSISPKISLIELAAFCGSLKCFKYLIVNQANVPENIARLAVHGGNTEIIRILQRFDRAADDKNYTKTMPRKIDFNPSIEVAARTLKNHILRWIWEEFPIESGNLHKSLIEASKYSNLDGILYCLLQGVDINSIGLYGSSFSFSFRSSIG